MNDGLDVGCAQGNVVGVAPHEADPMRVGADLRLVAREEDSLPRRAVAPVEDLEAVEMSAGVNEGEAICDLRGGSTPKADGRVGALQPWPIRFVEIDGDVVESVAPLNHRAVIVRMGDRDCGNATELADGIDGDVVEKADAVPKDISGR